MEQINSVAIQNQGGQVATLDSMTLGYETILKRKHVVQDVMAHIMKTDVHFGKVPGCGDKPTLLKPGAEAISSTFQLSPKYTISKTELAGGHREYEIVCDLYALNGNFVGSGVGSATTMEGKYRFRKAEQVCPECGKNTIIKGKKEYGGGWLCYKNKGGCGAKFPDGDPQIENQGMGRVEHDNPADYYNTVLKMAKKRAFVDAILTTTGASDIFTQDIEDMPEVMPGARQDAASEVPPASKQAQKPAGKQKPAPSDVKGTRSYATPDQIKAIRDNGAAMGISSDVLVADARRRFNDSQLEDISQLYSDEADAMLEALAAGQIGQPTATEQMGNLPNGY